MLVAADTKVACSAASRHVFGRLLLVLPTTFQEQLDCFNVHPYSIPRGSTCIQLVSYRCPFLEVLYG